VYNTNCIAIYRELVHIPDYRCLWLYYATNKLRLFIVVLLVLIVFTLLNFDFDEQKIKKRAYM